MYIQLDREAIDPALFDKAVRLTDQEYSKGEVFFLHFSLEVIDYFTDSITC